LCFFMAIVVSFSVYYKGVLFKLESDVLKEAEKINDISFMRSPYVSSAKLGSWEDNTRRVLEQNRKNFNIKIVKEKDVSKITKPSKSKPSDIEELFRYLGFLYDPHFPFSKDDPNYSIGDNKFIPKDKANRGEEILEVINILGHCYLFPEAPFKTDGVFKEGAYEKKHFMNIDDVRSWLEGLNVFVFESKKFLYKIRFVPENVYLKALSERDKKLIEKWKKSRHLKSFGNISPKKIFDDFIENVRKVIGIATSTQNQIERSEKRIKSLPQKSHIILIYILIGIVFISSVIAPLLCAKLPSYFYIRIPNLFYVGLIFYMFFVFIV